MTMHRHLINLLVAATLCVSARALAGDPKAGARTGTPSAAKSAPDHADELFEQATAAYDAGRLPEAHAKLLQAWALKKTHDIAGNLGVVELKLGEHAAAAEHLTWALQHFPPTEADQAKRGFEQKLAKARAQIGALRVRVNVEGAEVTVNGRSMGKAPLEDEAFVEAGTVRVSARREGYAAVEQVVSVQKGEAREVVLALVAVKPAAVVKAGPPLALVAASGALAVVGLAAGAGLTVAANGKATDRLALLGKVGLSGCAHSSNANAADCAPLLNTAKDQSTLRNGAVAAFATGGGLALVTAGLVVWAVKKPAPARDGVQIQVAPALGATERGVMVTGTW
jgi:tetratricopeptide (TPR) repeat protein